MRRFALDVLCLLGPIGLFVATSLVEGGRLDASTRSRGLRFPTAFPSRVHRVLPWMKSIAVAEDDYVDEDRISAGFFPSGSGFRQTCPPLFLPFGRVKLRSRSRVAKFLCLPGYQMVGQRFATCVRGAWNADPPICVGRACTIPSAPQHGRLTALNRVLLLKFTCDPGYTLMGSNALRCNGKEWNGTVPTCQGVMPSSSPPTECDFEKEADAMLCGWSQDTRDQFDWKRFSSSTPSGHMGTGPPFDHTLGSREGKDGYYMYIEASSPRKENDTARLFSPVFSSEMPLLGDGESCFHFWYHMYGINTGTLNVYVKPESKLLSEVSPSFSMSGDQGNQWFHGQVNLTAVGANNESFQIVIEGIRGPGYSSDIAIDDLAMLFGTEQCRLNSTFTGVTVPTNFTTGSTLASLSPGTHSVPPETTSFSRLPTTSWWPTVSTYVTWLLTTSPPTTEGPLAATTAAAPTKMIITPLLTTAASISTKTAVPTLTTAASSMSPPFRSMPSSSSYTTWAWPPKLPYTRVPYTHATVSYRSSAFVPSATAPSRTYPSRIPLPVTLMPPVTWPVAPIPRPSLIPPPAVVTVRPSVVPSVLTTTSYWARYSTRPVQTTASFRARDFGTPTTTVALPGVIASSSTARLPAIVTSAATKTSSRWPGSVGWATITVTSKPTTRLPTTSPTPWTKRIPPPGLEPIRTTKMPSIVPTYSSYWPFTRRVSTYRPPVTTTGLPKSTPEPEVPNEQAPDLGSTFHKPDRPKPMLPPWVYLTRTLEPPMASPRHHPNHQVATGGFSALLAIGITAVATVSIVALAVAIRNLYRRRQRHLDEDSDVRYLKDGEVRVEFCDPAFKSAMSRDEDGGL